MSDLLTLDQLIGANIRTLRRQQGGTQEKVAEALTERGVLVNQTQVGNMERGVRSVKAREIFALAAIFKVPIDRFFLPPAHLADTKLDTVREVIPAYQLVVDRILYPMDDPDFNFEAVVSMLVTDIISDRGETEAVMAIREAFAKALVDAQEVAERLRREAQERELEASRRESQAMARVESLKRRT